MAAKSRKPKQKASRPRKPARQPGSRPAAAPVHALLRDLPALACAPEIATLELEREAQAALHAANTPAPDAIERLATPAFHARLLVRLNELKNRALESGDDPLRFLVEAAVYYIEEARGPAWDNPLVVAIHARELARLEGREFGARDAVRAARDYERRHRKRLEAKLREREGGVLASGESSAGAAPDESG